MSIKQRLCGCGCGMYDILGRNYIAGHKSAKRRLIRRLAECSENKIKRSERKLRKLVKREFCKCGCGRLANPGRVFLSGYWSKTIEGRAKIRDGNIGKPRSDTLKKRWSELKKGIPRTEQDKIQMKLGWKRRRDVLKKDRLKVKQRDTKFIKSTVDEDNRKIIHICVHDELTKPEKRLRNYLNGLFPHEYKFVGNGLIFIDYKCPDFININGQKKIIEMFGDYWHSERVTGTSVKRHEQERIKHFAEYGYKTLIVWQKELKNISKLKRKLIYFHSS